MKRNPPGRQLQKPGSLAKISFPCSTCILQCLGQVRHQPSARFGLCNRPKVFNLDLPLYRLIVITGLSGSGKCSFAFDAPAAEV
jgi:hypothetical protein